jgi:hypothetical protein
VQGYNGAVPYEQTVRPCSASRVHRYTMSKQSDPAHCIAVALYHEKRLAVHGLPLLCTEREKRGRQSSVTVTSEGEMDITR